MAIKFLSGRIEAYDETTDQRCYLTAGPGGTFDVYSPGGILMARLGDVPYDQWEHLVISGALLTRSAANRPDLIKLGTTDVLAYGFDGGGKLGELHGNFVLHTDYKDGTDLYPFLTWYPTTSNSGNVKWQGGYWVVFGVGPTRKVQSGILSTVTPVSGVSFDNLVTEFETLKGTDVKTHTNTHFRLFRDSSDPEDTYPNDAAIGVAGLHYLSNHRGSATKHISK